MNYIEQNVPIIFKEGPLQLMNYVEHNMSVIYNYCNPQ